MSRTGMVYGQALYSLVRDEGVEKDVLEELKVLSDCFAGVPEFVRLLSAFSISKEERCRIADGVFRGKVHPYVLNFLKILTEKGRVRHFADCCKAYRELYDRDHNILVVEAVTAVALSGKQSRRLSHKLSRITGKTVELTNRVDPSCLGGVRLDYDGKRLDDTVAHRLEDIHARLMGK